MFKYSFLKTIYTISDADLVECFRYYMFFKYFLGRNLEDDDVHLSSLKKIRKLGLKDTDLLSFLKNKTEAIAVEKAIIRSKSIIVDATHTL